MPITWNGRPITAMPIADGKGSYTLPYFLREAGIDGDALQAALMSEAAFQPRDARHMRYRGLQLKRQKAFVTLCDRARGIPKYSYPGASSTLSWDVPIDSFGFEKACTEKSLRAGFTYRAVQHYQHIDDVPSMVPITDCIRKDLKIDGENYDYNQAIVTLYASGSDAIGWHNDKMRDIRPGSMIFDLSLGAKRTFSMQKIADDTLQTIEMTHGSAIVLSTEDNEAWKHAVLEEPHVTASRISIVFRDIHTLITAEDVRKHVERADRGA